MNDLISRQAAIDAINDSHFPGAPYVDTGINIALRIIHDLPSVQPERKTGKWIKEHIDITDKEHPKSFRFHRCSVCNHVAAPALFVDEEKWLSYCPHCGAYMKGGEDD